MSNSKPKKASLTKASVLFHGFSKGINDRSCGGLQSGLQILQKLLVTVGEQAVCWDSYLSLNVIFSRSHSSEIRATQSSQVCFSSPENKF